MHLRLREHENPDPVRTQEQRLISGVLSKDRKATAEFVALCADCAYPFIRRRLMPDTHFVEDMLQDVPRPPLACNSFSASWHLL